MKFNPNHDRFRATFSALTAEPRLSAVDRENGILHGVQITLEGEARGHGVFLDADFCHAVADAGNAMGDAGVKVRFGHPAMCSDALGTYLGRAKNFTCSPVTRKESGEQVCGVFADIFLDPNADRYDWVLNMAESAPDNFGQSIVFTYGDLKSLNANGEPILRSAYESDADFDAARGENKIFAVLGKLHGTDFTDTPAATDGVFSDGTSLAAEAEQMLLEHPEISETLTQHPEKALEFLDRMNLLSVLETKRIAGLQAAKDKQIAELTAKVDEAAKANQELREINANFSADLAARDAKITELADAAKAADEAHTAALSDKDAQLAALTTERDTKLAASAQELALAKEANTALTTERDTLSATLDTTTKALDEANANIKQLSGDLEAAKTSLATTQADLEAQVQRYRDQVGAALSQPESGLPDSAKSWTRAYRALKVRNH